MIIQKNNIFLLKELIIYLHGQIKIQINLIRQPYQIQINIYMNNSKNFKKILIKAIKQKKNLMKEFQILIEISNIFKITINIYIMYLPVLNWE